MNSENPEVSMSELDTIQIESTATFTRGETPYKRQVISDGLRELVKKQGLFGLGEAYVRGLWDSVDLEDFVYQAATSEMRCLRRLTRKTFGYLLRDRFFNAQVSDGVFEVGRRHYDLGNDLFAGMLDSSMSYTCGYWKDARNLDEAQEAKLQLICEKLELRPGMRVLDIGCGWGNLAAHAANKYGVSVVGVTISTEQAAFARERCRDLPVEIRLEDYRAVQGTFDRVVSIEMIEAVGRRNLSSYFGTVERCLEPKGLFLLQVISGETFSLQSSPSLDQYVVWLLKHIFPNGYLPKLREISSAGGSKLIVEDMHNLGADYHRTLQAWEANFEVAWPRLRAKYGDEFRRIWLYYLCGCRAMFKARLVNLFQVVYSKGGAEYKSIR